MLPIKLRRPWSPDLLSNSLTPSDTARSPACCYRNVFWEEGGRLNTGGTRGTCSPCSACIRWISVWVRLPSCTTPQSLSGKGARWKGSRLNPNQLVAARPPMCEETEGLCQTPSEWTDLTSGFTQVSCPSHLMRAKLSVSPGGFQEASSQYAALSVKDRLCCRGLRIFVGKRGRAGLQPQSSGYKSHLIGWLFLISPQLVIRKVNILSDWAWNPTVGTLETFPKKENSVFLKLGDSWFAEFLMNMAKRK